MALRQNLNGPEGLLLAVIDLAVKDYSSGGRYAASAAAYFNSVDYRIHLEALGLPADWKPTAVERDIQVNAHWQNT